MKKIIISWFVPAIVSAGLFLMIRPVLAQTIDVPVIASVGTEAVDGYTQIYFNGGGLKKFITSGNINSKMPVFADKYISYVTDINGAGQIFLYNISTDTKIQISFVGTNLNPKVDNKGRVIWESWDPSAGSGQGTWQVFLFDGKSIKKLTSGDLSLNPDFGGEYVSYARRDISGSWRSVVYSINDDKSVDVSVGEDSRTPKIKNGDIYLAAGSPIEKKFPLSVSDMFLLNLAPLTSSNSGVSTLSGTILNELSASPSAAPEISLIPQSTPSGQIEASPTPGI